VTIAADGLPVPGGDYTGCGTGLATVSINAQGQVAFVSCPLGDVAVLRYDPTSRASTLLARSGMQASGDAGRGYPRVPRHRRRRGRGVCRSLRRGAEAGRVIPGRSREADRRHRPRDLGAASPSSSEAAPRGEA
jgi:hypothetical protein